VDSLIAIISGGVGAAIVSVVGSLLLARQAQRIKSEDTESADVKALKEGITWLMYDRILYLSKHYVAAGQISWEDLRILTEMHRVYHDRLGGNGYLDEIMRDVKALPKEDEK